MKECILINNAYILGQRIGSGAFGDVYIAHHRETQQPVAIKMEAKHNTHHILYHEYEMYRRLMTTTNPEVVGIPKCYWYGSKEDYYILIIELLGISLDRYFKNNGCKLSLKNVITVGIQIIDRLEYLHSKGIIHRDIKPENFLFGKDNQTIYIIDFGLCKKYRNHQQQHIKMVENKKLVGTARYASVNSHRGIELSRRDDMESLGYMLVYLIKGSLPWQGVDGPKDEKYANIHAIKEKTTIEMLCCNIPQEFALYLKHVKSLGFEEKPNYIYLRELFNILLMRLNP